MYTRQDDIVLGTSSLVSLEMSNLSVMKCGSQNLVCYTSLSEVVVAPVPGTSSYPIGNPGSGGAAASVVSKGSPTCIPCETSQKLRCMFIDAGRGVADGVGYILILGSFGAKLVSLNGEDQLWYCSMETLAGQDDRIRPDAMYTRAAVLCRRDDNVIAIGLSNGYICLVYRASGELMRRLDGGQSSGTSRSSVVAIASTGAYLVSVNEMNCICVFDTQEDYALIHRISLPPAVEDLSTTLCCQGDNIVVGYLSGHIRVFSAKMGYTLFEITGHGRCVTGLSAHPNKEEFSSCGEDQCINVWSLPGSSAKEAAGAAEASSVELVHHEMVANDLLTGTEWSGDGRLYAVAYDSDIVRVVMPRAGRKM